MLEDTRLEARDTEQERRSRRYLLDSLSQIKEVHARDIYFSSCHNIDGNFEQVMNSYLAVRGVQFEEHFFLFNVAC